jgi:hypothetical protein
VVLEDGFYWISPIQVGEVKLVRDIGQATIQHPDAKPYIHDILLSMVLAEVRNVSK